MDDLAGRTIHGYELQERTGSGGFGAVYRAFQPSIGRQVAVKAILPEHASKPEFLQRFESEAKMVAELEHPYIVPLYDYWRDDEGAFLVMRWLPGGSLREALQKGAWSPERTARLLDQLADALSVAHEAGVIHRDIKPANILLDKRGNAYLTDFGIAKDLGSDTQLTGTGHTVGSPAYFAPEQIQGQRVSPRTDIYSLGVTLYEILTGERPFGDATPAMLVVKHLQESLPALQLTSFEPGQKLDAVIQKATAKDPEKRYADVLSLASDFHRAIETPADDASLSAGTLPMEDSVRPRKKRPALTPEQRNRSVLLDKVHQFWIKGVLEQSLHGVALLELGVEARPGAVDHPWEMVLQRLDKQPDNLPSSLWIADIFAEMGQALLILGEPGSGKTTVMLELARDLITEVEDNLDGPIPVVLNLSSWADKQPSLEEWIVEELNIRYLVPKRMGREWVKAQSLALMLDGLDEVKAEQRDACVEAINQFRAENGLTPLVVCSRIADYEALTTQLKFEGAVLLQPLEDQQIDGYLQRAGNELATLRTAIQDDSVLREMAHSPLMLSIMTLAYRGISADELPETTTVDVRRKHLFDTYIARMFQRRGQDGKYASDRTTKWLSWLAGGMKTRDRSILALEDLSEDWLPSSGLRGRFKLRVTALVFALSLVYVLLSAILVSASGFLLFPETTRARLPLTLAAIPVGALVTGIIFALITWQRPQRRWGLLAIRTGLLLALLSLILSLPIAILGASTSGDFMVDAMREAFEEQRTAQAEALGVSPEEVMAPFGNDDGLSEEFFRRLGTMIGLFSFGGIILNGLIGGVFVGQSARGHDTTGRLLWTWSTARRGAGVGCLFAVGLAAFASLLMVGAGVATVISLSDLPEVASVLETITNSIPVVIAIVVGMFLFLTALYSVMFIPLMALPVFLLYGLGGRAMEASTSPNQGMQRSYRNGLKAALVVGGIPAGIYLILMLVGQAPSGLLTLALTGNPTPLVASIVQALGVMIQWGVFFGFPAGLILGWRQVIKHNAVKRLLQREGLIARDLVDFLDYCNDLIFLRKVGGGYIFVHRVLQDHFASQTRDDSRSSASAGSE